MVRLIFVFLSCISLVGCGSRQLTSSSNASLTVLDLSADFPFRKVDIHDIADVEYVLLETNENSLLTNTCSKFFVSDDYIITADLNGGNIFFFNRSGKHLWTVNRRGQGNEEYTRAVLNVDFEAEECFVYDSFKRKIFVYDFHGIYKRTLSGPPRLTNFWFHNYDKDYLLGYNNFYDNETQRYDDEHPYYLVSKVDGSMHPIDLTIKNRIGSKVHSESVNYSGGHSSIERTIFLINPIIMNGSDLLIADFTLDTLFCFNDRKLTPIAVRTPAVRATNPPVILNPIVYTDSLFYFEMMPYYYNPSNPYEAYNKLRKLACNRRTGEIEEIELYNSDSSDAALNMGMKSIRSSTKKMGVCWCYPEGLLERYNDGLLKGKLKEVASKLKMDDNKVLILCKFK